MARSSVANLGFLLQISGILTVLPIGIGFYYNETQAIIPLFITCITFLCLGFFLNSLCERKELNIKSSSILLLSAFIILPLIGSIPFLYLDPFNSSNPIDRVSNSYFESVSGFTTTGFSFVPNSELLPRSILVFRSLTEVMGGIGIIFIILAFFQSKRSLLHLGNTLGFENTNSNYRKMFLWVLSIYGIFILLFTGIYYFLGLTDIVKTGTFVIDVLTGGFSPSTQQMPQYLFVTSKILMITLMTLGSVNFIFNYQLFTGKIRKMFTKEIVLYFLIIGASTIAIFAVSKLQLIDSLFHVVSMTSATGIAYVNILSLNSTATTIFISLILIGGCSFSMAGGIKVSRILALLKSIPTAVQLVFFKEHGDEYEISEDQEKSYDQFSIVIAILLFLATLFIFASLFSTLGVSFENSIFEMGSALSTNGVTTGIINVTMPVAYKWLTVAAMTIGRVEILTILVALIPIKIYGSNERSR